MVKVEVKTTNLINLGQSLNLRPVQNSKSQRNHLQILGTSGGGDVARLGPDIEDDGSL